MFRRFFCLCLSLAVLALFFSCSRGKGSPVLIKAGAEEPTKSGRVEKAADKPVEEKPPVNPEYEKIKTVVSKMSPRFKEVVKIPESNYDEFLADLHSALEAEKDFPADDLSLYYLIDKKHSVEESYVPKGLVKVTGNSHYNVSRNDLSLRPDVEKALTVMADAALEDGIKLMVSSTYRSYEYQKNLFARYVREDGEELASRYSAKPGTSQHQLGVAIDFGSVTDDFALTKMGKWLNQHSEEYGWSLSFPQEYEDVTGFMWECWHFRYIGKPACLLQNKWFGDVQQFMIEFIDEWKKS